MRPDSLVLGSCTGTRAVASSLDVLGCQYGYVRTNTDGMDERLVEAMDISSGATPWAVGIFSSRRQSEARTKPEQEVTGWKLSSGCLACRRCRACARGTKKEESSL